MIRVAFQGEPGAYGEEAIVRYFGDDATAVAMPTFASVYGSVMERVVGCRGAPVGELGGRDRR